MTKEQQLIEEAKYGTVDIHRKYFSLLCMFDEYCRSHHINYSIYAGTLLGAVRNGNFIPWDDDVDLVMERSEFCKLQESIMLDTGCLPQGTSIKMDLHFNRLWSTIENESIFIDVFVSDSVPDNFVCRWIKFSIIFVFRECIKGKLLLGQPCRKMLSYLVAPFTSVERLRKKMHGIAQWGNGRKTRCLANYFDQRHGWLNQFKSSIFDTYIGIKINGKEFMAVGGYKEMLTKIYGLDYMTPPQDKMRGTNHACVYHNMALEDSRKSNK